MPWKSILDAKRKLGKRCDNTDMRMFLDTMTTALGFSALCQFSQETPEEEKISAGHGKMYQMTLLQKEKKHCIELVLIIVSCM